MSASRHSEGAVMGWIDQALAATLPGETLAGWDAPPLPEEAFPADVIVVPLDGSVEPFWATSDWLDDERILVNASVELPEGMALMLEVRPRGVAPMRIKVQIERQVLGHGFYASFVAMTERTATELEQLLRRH